VSFLFAEAKLDAQERSVRRSHLATLATTARIVSSSKISKMSAVAVVQLSDGVIARKQAGSAARAAEHVGRSAQSPPRLDTFSPSSIRDKLLSKVS
jgi:hypothetical protein